MSTPSRIVDDHSGRHAQVTKYGQLVVSPLQFSTPVEQEMTATATAYNFAAPESGKSIVITDIIVFADRTVSNTTPADIQIYTADAPDSTTPINGIVSPQLTSGQSFVASGLNLLVDEGVWLNAQTDDATVLITVMFYRIPAEKV